MLLVGIPASLMLSLLATPILSTLFHHGHFTAMDVLMTRQSVLAFALGVTPFMLVKILASGFYAKQKMRTPVRVGVIAMVANIALNGIFIWPFAHAGIALATSVAALLNTGLLFYLLYKNHIYQPRAGWKGFAIRLSIANLVLALWLWLGGCFSPAWLLETMLWRVEHLLILMLSAVLLYFAALFLTGVRLSHLLIPATA